MLFAWYFIAIIFIGLLLTICIVWNNNKRCDNFGEWLTSLNNIMHQYDDDIRNLAMKNRDCVKEMNHIRYDNDVRIEELEEKIHELELKEIVRTGNYNFVEAPGPEPIRTFDLFNDN